MTCSRPKRSVIRLSYLLLFVAIIFLASCDGASANANPFTPSKINSVANEKLANFVKSPSVGSRLLREHENVADEPYTKKETANEEEIVLPNKAMEVLSKIAKKRPTVAYSKLDDAVGLKAASVKTANQAQFKYIEEKLKFDPDRMFQHLKMSEQLVKGSKTFDYTQYQLMNSFLKWWKKTHPDWVSKTPHLDDFMTVGKKNAATLEDVLSLWTGRAIRIDNA